MSPVSPRNRGSFGQAAEGPFCLGRVCLGQDVFCHEGMQNTPSFGSFRLAHCLRTAKTFYFPRFFISLPADKHRSARVSTKKHRSPNADKELRRHHRSDTKASSILHF